MARNTNIDEALFPVGFADIFIEGMTESKFPEPVKIPVDKYRAIINQYTGDVLCVVTKDYKLITNKEAFELGKECYKKIFDIGDTKDFEVFNITTPSTKTFCHIDIIKKGYEVNIWKQEVYLPYIRITNSYNRTKSLSFDLGFCRKLCDNGVIFEKEAIRCSFYHTRQIIKEIQFDILPEKLDELRRKFIEYANKLSEVSVPKPKAVPLMLKILDIKFDLDKKDGELKGEIKRMDEIEERAGRLAEKYYKQLGENAYAIFNACTDYATYSKSGDVNVFADSMQKRIGNWVEEFSEAKQMSGFSLENYIGDYGEYLN